MEDNKNKSSKSTKSSTRPKPGTDTRSKANKDVLDFTKKIYESLSDQRDTQDKINDSIKESSIYYKDLSNSAIKAQKAFTDILKVMENTKDESDEYLKNMQDIIDTMDDYADLIEDLVENTKNLGSISYEQLNTNKLQNKLLKTKIQLEGKAKKLAVTGNEEAAKSMKQQISNVESLLAQIKAQQKIIDLQDKVNEKLKEAGTSVEEMTEEMTAFGDSAMGVLKNLPGGSMLSKALGFGKIQKEFKEKVGGSITESLMKSAEAGKSGMSSMFSAMIAGARAFTAVMLANPIFAIAAIIIGIILLFKKVIDLANKIDEETSDIAKSFTISKDRARELKHEMNGIGISAKELVVDLEVMNQAFGNVTAQVLQLNEAGFKTIMSDVQRFTYNMGLSTEEASSLISVLQDVDDAFSPDKATTFTSMTEGAVTTSHAFEEMLKATESVNDSLGLVGKKRFNLTTMAKLLAGISKTTMAMFKGSVQQLIKANMQMKLLGTNADTMAKVAGGLLDIEASVTKEYEDRALTGSTINYDQLRFMSLTAKTQKDLANMATYMYNQLDKQDLKWEDMTHWQKEARAEALQMGVDEVDAMYKQGKILKQLGNAAGEKLLQHIKDGKLLEEDVANMQKLDEATRQQLMGEAKVTSLKQQQEHIMDVMTQRIEQNLPGLGNFVQSLADIGNRLASGESLWSVMTGGGISKVLTGKGQEDTEIQQGMSIKKQIGASDDPVAKKELDEAIKENTTIGKQLLQASLNRIAHPISSLFESPRASLERAREMLTAEAARDFQDQQEAKKKGNKIEDAYFPSGRASAIMGDDGEFYYPNRNDSVLVTTNNIKPTRVNTMTGEQVNSSTNSNSSSETIKLLREQNKLLASLLGAVDQPVKLNLNGIDKEIGNMQSLRKNYGGRISNTYGATHGF